MQARYSIFEGQFCMGDAGYRVARYPGNAAHFYWRFKNEDQICEAFRGNCPEQVAYYETNEAGYCDASRLECCGGA